MKDWIGWLAIGSGFLAVIAQLLELRQALRARRLYRSPLTTRGNVVRGSGPIIVRPPYGSSCIVEANFVEGKSGIIVRV